MKNKRFITPKVLGVGIGVALSSFPLTALAISYTPILKVHQPNPGRSSVMPHILSPQTTAQHHQRDANTGSKNAVATVFSVPSNSPENFATRSFTGNFEQEAHKDTQPVVTYLKSDTPVAVVSTTTSRQPSSSKNDPSLWLWFIGVSSFGLFILWRFVTNLSSGKGGRRSNDNSSFFNSSNFDSFSGGSDSDSDGGDFGGGGSEGGGEGGDW